MNLHDENLGARRLHSIVEKVLEELSFNASGMEKKEGSKINIDIDETFVKERLKGFWEKTNVRKNLIWYLNFRNSYLSIWNIKVLKFIFANNLSSIINFINLSKSKILIIKFPTISLINQQNNFTYEFLEAMCIDCHPASVNAGA